MMPDLSETFLAHLADGLVPQAQAMPQLEQRLGDLVAAGRIAYGELSVPEHAFVAHVAALLPAESNVAAFLAQVIAEDLYLACACSRKDRDGLAVLERRYGKQIDGAVSVLKHEYLQAEDLRQIVRNKLYVGTENSPPAITRYNGLGTLGGWLRVLSMRAGLNAVRQKGRPAAGARSPDVLAPALADPELDYLKSTYRESFKEAFLLAVAELSRRERTLLRQSLVHKLSVREIGRMYGVHYATASRWIAEARKRLAERTRDELAERLGLTQEQLDSIMRLIQSRLDVSVAQALAESSSGA